MTSRAYVPTCRLKYVKLQVEEQYIQSLVHNVQPQSVHQVMSGLIRTCYLHFYDVHATTKRPN